MRDLKAVIRDIPDFPKPGILFRDITPLLLDAAVFRETVVADLPSVPESGRHRRRHRVARLHHRRARGLRIWARASPSCASRASCRPLRSKLATTSSTVATRLRDPPRRVSTMDSRVLIVDDLLATGGTACAAVELVRRTGGEVVGVRLRDRARRARRSQAPGTDGDTFVGEILRGFRLPATGKTSISLAVAGSR